ncbi:hypothetical protein K458DRAFT_383316 [Lentithecium fluviatile CBS 122367]|uniref:Uncharacterized protein n=1 Tax=Lentithecium fluviatile CBS 122367 TaxID=1168545 RepID=A0A6G1JJ38_9PLEO|nr:hypothetical protein K458DRAFT_383316 [Lentithecium fluviatile CBS 122367]
MAEHPQNSALQLAEQLSQGFAALSGEYQILFNQQRLLESKLSWAKQQYLDLLKRFTPDTLSQDHCGFLHELEQVSSNQNQSPSDWVEQIARSDDIERRERAALIKQAESALASLHSPTADAGVKIWSGPLADREKPALRIDSNVDLSHLEKDFTTTGTPSRLGCPFASNGTRQSPLATPRSSTSRMSLKGRRSKRPSFNDPIRAEICGNDLVAASASASADGSAAVCPIRFLDQHAPEEVAKYFEKHKHELPRSHEVCINRFQSNAESIQQLDRKYGNLVSMIQGLGEKHQAWLPEEPEEDADALGNDTKADVKVEKWATAVTASLHDLTPGEEDSPNRTVDEGRTAHFDRPLKEIRVGESPSRPWGISIPPKYTDAESSSSVGSAPTASPPLPLDMSRPIGETPKKPGECPFGHMVKGDGSKVQERGGPAAGPRQKSNLEPPVSSLEQPTELKPGSHFNSEQAQQQRPELKVPEPETPKVVPQMIFNGPVFLGYPPDQLVSILQNSNLGAALR